MTARKRRGRPWSITRRLTVLYAGTAFLVLTAAAGVLYWGLARTLRGGEERFAEAKGRELHDIAVRFPGRVDMLRDEISVESAMPSLQSYSARILAADGTVEAVSKGMDARVPVALFPRHARGPVEWRAADGHAYLLYSEPLAAPDGPTAQVAIDISRDTDVLDVQLALLAAVVLVGTLATGGAGYVIARRGLRPVAHIAGMATRVSADRLDDRLGGTRWPAELAELARVFDGMLDRLQESFARLGRFSADIAHELRTPLPNLRGTAEVALRKARTPEEYRDVLESALEEYGRLADLVDRLLFLARADAGAAVLQPRPVDLRVEMDAAREYFTPLAEDAGIAIETTGTAAMEADPALVRRAVANVIGNAVAHTPRGGRVTASAAFEPGWAVVRVADTGSGISPEDLPHVFERFFHAGGDGGPHRAGAGLGLAIVRAIMEMHGGAAEIESAPGAGTTLTLRFPAATPREMTMR